MDNNEILVKDRMLDAKETLLKEKFSEMLFRELFDEEVMKILKKKMEKIKDGRFALTHEQNKLEVWSNSVMWVVYLSSLILFCLAGLKLFGRIGLMAGCFSSIVFSTIFAGKLHDYCVRKIKEKS